MNFQQIFVYLKIFITFETQFKKIQYYEHRKIDSVRARG